MQKDLKHAIFYSLIPQNPNMYRMHTDEQLFINTTDVTADPQPPQPIE